MMGGCFGSGLLIRVIRAVCGKEAGRRLYDSDETGLALVLPGLLCPPDVPCGPWHRRGGAVRLH